MKQFTFSAIDSHLSQQHKLLHYDTTMKLLVLFLLTTFSALQSSKANPGYQKVDSRVAVANHEMSAGLKSQLWPSATRVWEPKAKQVLGGLLFLESEKGKNAITEAAQFGMDMHPCISKITETRFQVYGFVIKGRKCLLFDSAPNISTPQIGVADKWLSESIAQSVYDGGSAFWFVLLDVDTSRVIASGRRPD